MDNPAHELVVEKYSIPMSDETLLQQDIDEIASSIMDLARAHQGHRFDKEYMDTHDGAYGISTITLDTQLNPHAYTMKLYRPTSHGGHVAFRTGKEIEKILPITFDTLSTEDAGSQELMLMAAKFRDMECILLVPSELQHPRLYRALELDVIGNGTDTMAFMELRLCDGLGLGRSPPHVSTGKFKFLFPGVDIDTSQVKQRATKRQRGTPTEHPTKREKNGDDVLASLHIKIDDAMRVSNQAKKALHQMAKNFLSSFHGKAGHEKFGQTFTGYVTVPNPIILEIFGNLDIVENIVRTADIDQTACDDIIRDVHNIHYLAHMLNPVVDDDE